MTTTVRTHALAALLAAVAAAGLAVAPAGAQSPRSSIPPAPVRFSIAGGLAAPTGDLSDVANIGLGGIGSAEFRPAGFPVALRADLSYQRFGIDGDKLEVVSGLKSGNANYIGGQLNGVLRFGGSGAGRAASSYRPYALGGVGLYRAAYTLRANNGGQSKQNEIVPGFGFGAGMGFTLGAYETFVEARYQNVRTKKVSLENEASSFFPVVVGVRF